MGIENQPDRSSSERSWKLYLLIIGIIVGVLVALNVTGIRNHTKKASRSETSLTDSTSQGDFYIKYAMSGVRPAKTKYYVQKAIELYREDIPSPAAYRRIGVAKQEYLKESGLNDLARINSPRATKVLKKRQIAKLDEEARMWRDIYTSRVINKASAAGYIARIKKSDLGPLKKIVIARVYRVSGDPAKADGLIKDAKQSALLSIFAASGLFIGLALAGIVGVIFIAMFLVNYGDDLKRAGFPQVQSSVLFISFLTYLVSFFVLSIILQTLLLAAGLDVSDDSNTIVYLIMQVVAMLGAYALGKACLRTLASSADEDPAEISPKKFSFFDAVRWGVGGYCAALPLLAAGALISNSLFKGFKTPEHPILPVISQGGAEFVIAFIMGAVLAPIVEETAFRGMLYTGLRTKMGVWAAAVLSGAIFSIIHPTLPGGFLPILALGTVFALLREKTGSLLPGMIAHGLNNALMFLLVRLFY